MFERVQYIAYSQLTTVNREMQTGMGKSMPNYIKIANDGRNSYKVRSK